MKNINKKQKMKKPIIGIIPDYKTGSENSYSIRPHYALRCNYVEMLNKAGAAVIILPYDFSSIDKYLELLDGLMIVGGHFDIHPKRYNESEVHKTIVLNEVRENFEFEFTQKALKTNMPILGICNGMQLLSIISGGSIIQHIPDAGTYLNHEQSKTANPDSHNPHHEVNIDKTSKLYQIIGKEKISTNSSHHQAVKNVGAALKISAYASDNIIEGVENPLHPFCIGVQWHPEFDVSSADRKIFSEFVKAAQNYKN